MQHRVTYDKPSEGDVYGRVARLGGVSLDEALAEFPDWAQGATHRHILRMLGRGVLQYNDRLHLVRGPPDIQ